MDAAALSEWLKNSVPGIILLGAVGSIFAALVLWLANRFLLPLFRGYLFRVLVSLIRHFVSPAVTQHVRLHFLQAKDKIQLFYALQILKVVFALFFSSCGFLVFLFAVSSAEGVLFRASVVVPLVIAFLGLWYALRCLVIVVVPMYFDIDAKIQEAVSEALTAMEKNP